MSADPFGALKRSPGISVTWLAPYGAAKVSPERWTSSGVDMMEKDEYGYRIEEIGATIEAVRVNMERGGGGDEERKKTRKGIKVNEMKGKLTENQKKKRNVFSRDQYSSKNFDNFMA
jgi:hypothetical protein